MQMTFRLELIMLFGLVARLSLFVSSSILWKCPVNVESVFIVQVVANKSPSVSLSISWKASCVSSSVWYHVLFFNRRMATFTDSSMVLDIKTVHKSRNTLDASNNPVVFTKLAKIVLILSWYLFLCFFYCCWKRSHHMHRTNMNNSCDISFSLYLRLSIFQAMFRYPFKLTWLNVWIQLWNIAQLQSVSNFRGLIYLCSAIML